MNAPQSKAVYMPAPDQSARNTTLPLATRRPSIHAVLRFSGKAKVAPTRWAAELLVKKPYNVVAVALANKMARIVWALMTTGRRFEATAAL